MKIYQTRLGNLSTSVDVNGVPRRGRCKRNFFYGRRTVAAGYGKQSGVWETIQIVGHRTTGIGRENLYVSAGGSLLAGRKGLFEKRTVRAF